MASNPKASGTAPAKDQDFITRGQYGTSSAGNATLVGLRALDPVIQYGILGKGLGSTFLHKIGLTTLQSGPPNTGTFLDRTGLSPYRLILLAMATGTSIKHIIWVTAIANEEYRPPAAAFIGIFNSFITSINTLAFTTTVASASLSSNSQFPQTTLLVGSVLWVAGMAIELGSEVERKRFKDDPANKGKLYTDGLWKFSRHANYFGHLLSRVGFSVAASGWTMGALTSAFYVYSFLDSSIPSIEGYTSKRYGTQWQEYERKTPYKLIPFAI